MHYPLASTASANASGKKRLIICFDIISNVRDQDTSMLHHYELTLDRVDVVPVLPKRYCVTGVGAGLPEYG